MSHRAGQAIAQLIGTNEAAGQSDGQLLRHFLAHRAESTFVALVQRHGPMVLAVCRRVLRNEADAEDAFQATFLVLVRKAGSLSSRVVLGDWLHGVARRTALNAKRLAVRRRVQEQKAARPEAREAGEPDEWLPLLDEALRFLPDKYRLPIVLCDLEGRTRREAAEQLGWPEGTVAGRQARGRAMLSERLTRRGFVLPAGSLALTLSAGAATAVASSLLALTARAASLAGSHAAGGVPHQVLELTQGVIRGMVLSKLKIWTAVMLVAAVIVGFAAAAAVLYRDRIPETVEGRKQALPEPIPRVVVPPAPEGPRKLLDVATRQPRFEGEFCGWLSADTALLALPDPARPRGRLVRRTLSSRVQEDLPELTKLYNLADGGSAPQVSPDGRWVLWWDAKIHDVTIYGARVDGSGHFLLPKAKTQWDNMYLLWMADSRRFVELVTPDNKTFSGRGWRRRRR